MLARIWKTGTNKHWQVYGKTGTLIHCWREYKTVQSLRNTVWHFFINRDNSSTPRPERTENICPHENLYTNVQSSIICDKQDVEMTQRSLY